MFSNVLITDSTYKTNKYRLSLLETIGLTSTEKTFSVGFAFLKSEKEDNVTWVLEMCKTRLRDKKNMSKVIVTDHDTTLMDLVAKVFLTLNILLVSIT